MSGDLALDDLPTVVQQVVALIGLDGALRIMKIYAGIEISLAEPRRREVITSLIGKDKAAKLFARFDRGRFYLPRCANDLKKIRNRQIRKDADTMAMDAVGAKWGLQERQIWNILKESADTA